MNKARMRQPENSIERQLAGLTLSGFEDFEGIYTNMSENRISVKEVRPIIRNHLRKSKRINRRHNSYGLKHIAERIKSGISYLSNGEMIYAMALEGFKVERDGKNCYFNIYEKDYINLYLLSEEIVRNRMEAE